MDLEPATLTSLVKYRNFWYHICLMSAIFIDTSTDTLVLALADKEKIIDSYVAPHHNKLSEFLLPTIEKLLKNSGKTLQDLEYIASGIGPGSYTGTRVGSAVAASFAFALEIPLITFPSLLAFLPFEEGSFIALKEAKNGKIFALTGSKSKQTFNSLSEQLASYEEIKNKLPSFSYAIGCTELFPSSLKAVFNPTSLAGWAYEKWLLKDYSLDNVPKVIYFH